MTLRERERQRGGREGGREGGGEGGREGRREGGAEGGTEREGSLRSLSARFLSGETRGGLLVR
jgi:hypothetical protein